MALQNVILNMWSSDHQHQISIILEMHIFRPSESETLKLRVRDLSVTSSPSDSGDSELWKQLLWKSQALAWGWDRVLPMQDLHPHWFHHRTNGESQSWRLGCPQGNTAQGHVQSKLGLVSEKFSCAWASRQAQLWESQARRTLRNIYTCPTLGKEMDPLHLTQGIFKSCLCIVSLISLTLLARGYIFFGVLTLRENMSP